MDWQYATRFGGGNKLVNQILTPLNYPHHLELDAEGNAYIFGTYGDGASFYGYPDDYFDGQTWDVKKIDDANESTIRSYIKNGRKADNVIMYFEKDRTSSLTNAILREAGKRKHLGELNSLPNIYLINDKGELTQFWNKKSGLVKSALGSEN